MKKAIENIIKALNNLNENTKNFALKNLSEVIGEYNKLTYKNEALKNQITGIKPPQQNDALLKAIDLLKLHGYTELSFDTISPDFLNWFIENTLKIKKYNPRLINWYMITAMQKAYYITIAESQTKIPTYNQVKKNLLHFDDVIKQYEQESKLSFDKFLNRLHGTD